MSGCVEQPRKVPRKRQVSLMRIGGRRSEGCVIDIEQLDCHDLSVRIDTRCRTRSDAIILRDERTVRETPVPHQNDAGFEVGRDVNWSYHFTALTRATVITNVRFLAVTT